MLVKFKVKNYKSFKDEIEFSLESTKLKQHKETNTFEIHNLSLLKSAVVYGANASGKSNLLNAMKKMKSIINNSPSIEKQKKYPHEPFLLNINTEKEASMFECTFVQGSNLYRYGFIIEATSNIKEEWLYQKKLKKYAQEVALFTRLNREFNLGSSFSEAKDIESKTRENALFLPVVAQWNGSISQEILAWFDKLTIISNLRSEEFKHFSFEMLEDEEFRERIVKFIKSADTGITDIKKKKIDFASLNIENDELKELPNFLLEKLKEEGLSTVETMHMQYDNNNMFKQLKSFSLDFESDGTQKLLALSAPLIDALLNGEIIVVDELDNSLHTDLVQAIVKLFNCPKSNPNNAQLIFSTHDTNLLNQELFRRDQIWFVQKDIYGSSELYSLIEYGEGKIREDLALEKNYLNGKFGGKPYISSSLMEL